MTRKQITYSILSLVFFTIAFVYNNNQADSDRLDIYAKKIGTSLSSIDIEIDLLLKDPDFIKRRISSKEYQANSNLNVDERDLEKLLGLTNAAYTLVFKKEGKFLFWTNNKTPYEHFNFNNHNTNRPVLNFLDNGYYIIEQKPSLKGLEDIEVWSFIPLKYAYKLNSEHLVNGFNSTSFIPLNAELDLSAGNIPINYRNEPIAHLVAKNELVDRKSTKTLALIVLLAFIFLGMFINKTCVGLAEKYNLGVGAGALIILILGLKTLNSIFGFTDKFEQLSLFNKDFVNFTLSSSLGDFLINVVLMLWIILFFHRNIDQYRFSHLSKPLKHVLGFLNVSVICMSIVNIANVSRGLILDSNIQFDFDNILNLNHEAFLAIFGVILLSFGLFLFSHLLMLMIMRMEIPRINRQVIYFVATLLTIPSLSLFNLDLDVIRFSLFIIFYLVLFDIFVHNRLNNLAWLVIWIVIMSIFSSTMIYKFNSDKDIAIRKAYALALSDEKDETAEEQINALKDKLNFHFNNIAYQSLSEKLTLADNLTYDFFTDNTYLYNNYTYNLEPVLKTEDIPFYTSNNKGSYNYHFSCAKKLNADSLIQVNIIRAEREQSKVYTELMQSLPFKGLDKLDQYDYAIYKNFKNEYRTAMYYGEALNQESVSGKKGSYEVKNEDMHSEVIYYGEDGNCVFISKKTDGWIKPISLFSYLFGLLIILILCIGFLNILTSFIPKSLSFSVIRKPSLKNRIQLSVISIIIVSFIIIGLVTVLFFQNSHVQYHEDRLQRKTKAVIRDINHELNLHLKQDSSLLADNKLLERLDLKAISNIHRLDINLFQKDGSLIKTSENDFFTRGIISSQMSPSAFMALHQMGQDEFVLESEKLGVLPYKTAFIPLSYNKETLAYMGLPYYSENSRTRSDATTFMGTLLNVYVFLLLIAGVIAIVMANSITKPISVIGQKLNQFRLGGKNEPLEWKSKDELGALIKEYNKMVAKIGESAELLAQSEREGAWREMAKQVAHEIKNPLTPMKLSIQYLMHAVKGGADNVEELMQRVSNTLIQQIDNLAQIADEFSNFAKMPRAENQKLPINNLVTSVFDLFSEVEDVDLTLTKPDHDLWVYADKNHLVSVFNNIIKNAIQAIPEEREGFIHVKLYEEDGLATVRISDNGSGITDEMKEKVFVPNFTTKSSGTGLGLAISKNIIESVNGRIRFETEVGKGTDFYVTLPIIDVKKPEMAEV